MPLRRTLPVLTILIILIITACQPAADAVIQTAPSTLTAAPPTAAATLEPTSVPAPSPTPAPPSLWAAKTIPDQVWDMADLPSGWQPAASPETASLRLEVNTGQPVSHWIYVLAAPFPTLTDDIAMVELKGLWVRGKLPHAELVTLAMDPAVAALFTEVWGPPSGAVKTAPADELLELAWEEPTTWCLIPFEAIQPRWKVISVNGQNPLHKDFDPQQYSLSVDFGLSGDADLVDTFLQAVPGIPASNRLADQLTTVILTGVTALVRGTASTMESRGMTYPAQDIGPWLREADILHVNNEVPFARDCPAPYPWDGLVFCSQTRYIELLEDIGVDVMDLSGDHFADWGPEAMRYTLELYQQRGWPIYGGGATAEEAQQPALFEHNGNRIAFIGCNYKAKGYATASATNPGAVHCDPAWLYPAIEAAAQQGYLPIVTFQHEEYYEYIARPQLQQDFRGAAEAGAIIVSGSQAHQPHALDFDGQALIHYGLGNLFFDQIGSMDSTNTAFIDRHVFYQGRYLGVELLSIRFVDYARPRITTPEERQALLRTVFTASGW